MNLFLYEIFQILAISENHSNFDKITWMMSASFPLRAYSGDIKSKSGLLASFVMDAAACNSFCKAQECWD